VRRDLDREGTDEHVIVAGALTFGMGDTLTKGAGNKTLG
jgi:hypothetical protein